MGGLIAETSYTREAEQAEQTEKPNIVFIITDQQFADAMSCRMDYQYINTLVMDDLAANGILFSMAYSANLICLHEVQCL